MTWFKTTDIGSRDSKSTYLLSMFLVYMPRGNDSKLKSLENLQTYKDMYDSGTLKDIRLRVYFDDSVLANQSMNSFIEENKNHSLFEFIYFIASSYQFEDENNIKRHPSYLASLMRHHALFYWDHEAKVVCIADIFSLYTKKSFWKHVESFSKKTTKQDVAVFTSKFNVPDRGAVIKGVNDSRKNNGRWVISSMLIAKTQLPEHYFNNAIDMLENSFLGRMRYIDALRGSLKLNSETKIQFQFLENFERGIDEVFINEIIDALEEENHITVKVIPYRQYNIQKTFFDIAQKFTAYMRWNRNKTKVYDEVRYQMPEKLSFKGDTPIYFKSLYKNSEPPIPELMKTLRPHKSIIDSYKRLQMDLRLIYLIETYKSGDENIDDVDSLFTDSHGL